MPVTRKNYRRRRPRKPRANKKLVAIKKNGIIPLSKRPALGMTNMRECANLGRILPRCIKGVLPLQITYAVSLADTTPQIYTFCLNSLYDPTQALGTNQPHGFDKLSALYGSYYVYGTSVQIDCLNGGNVPIECSWICVGSESFSAGQSFSGLDMTANKIIGTEDETHGWKFYVDNYKVLGYKNTRLRERNPLTAIVSADPGNKSRLQINMVNMATATQTFYLTVKFDFHYVMFDDNQSALLDA